MFLLWNELYIYDFVRNKKLIGNASILNMLKYLSTLLHVKSVLVLLALIFIVNEAKAQITGRVKNLQGEPLSFATLFVKSTTQGVTTNQDGVFSFQLSPGSYTLVVQYIGYEQKEIMVSIQDKPLDLSIYLEEISYNLDEVTIRATDEDLAYRIMRQVMSKRQFYKDYLKSYSIDVYIKGLFKLEEVPLFFKDSERLKNQIGMDSTGKGILYLSESESKVYFKAPDKTKEIMVSSKVSGDDRGFSFNRFGFLDFYQPEISFNRKIANPIGPYAFTYYTFRHEQSFYDQERRLIHKIRLDSKVSDGPAFSGTIYILDKKWLVHSVDLKLSGKALQIEFMDTLHIKQQYIPADDTYWGLFSQVLQFDITILGLKFSGSFNAITQNYELNPMFEKGFFNREIVKIEPNSNQKDNLYWETNRPVPLTDEESKDYVLKDSLSSYLNSKAYLDSIDRKLNAFKIGNLLGKYNYRNSYEGKMYSGNIASQIFNSVQGFSLGLGLGYERSWRDTPGKLVSLNGKAIFGFSDRRVRYQLDYLKRFDARYQTYIAMSVGDVLSDFNPHHSIPDIYNAFLMLTRGESLIRYFNQQFATIEAGREIGVGQFLAINMSFRSRSLAENSTDYSFASGENIYPLNDAFDRLDRVSTESHHILTYELNYTLRLFAKYISYPDQRFYRSSIWPLIKIRYKGTYGRTREELMQSIDITLSKDNVWRTLLGNLSFNFNMGYFLVAPYHFQDYQHFIGNPVLLINRAQYLRGFKLHPLYQFSTSATFAQLHSEWNDKGFLLRQVPLLGKLGWNVILGHSALSTQGRYPYQEFFVSMDRIGYSIFRILRIDFVWGGSAPKLDNFGIRLAVNSRFR